MSLQDPIADMLTRIRNGLGRNMRSVSMPSSKQKVAIAGIMKEEGYITDFAVDGEESKRTLTIELKYYQGKPVIEMLRRASRPSLRQYRKSGDIERVKGGLGVAIVSTSRGLMTDRAARSQHIGGEVICIIA